MLIDRKRHGLEAHRDTARAQLLDTAAALFERPRNLCDLLVGLFRVSVDADLDEHRRVLGEKVRDAIGDHRAVREESHKKSATNGVQIDLFEIRPNQNLSTGQEKEDATLIRNFVDEFEEARSVELSRTLLGITGRFVDIAVDAAQVATKRRLNRPAQWNAGGCAHERELGKRALGHHRPCRRFRPHRDQARTCNRAFSHLATRVLADGKTATGRAACGGSGAAGRFAACNGEFVADDSDAENRWCLVGALRLGLIACHGWNT